MKPSIWTDVFQELKAEDSVERLARVGWRYLELAGIHLLDIVRREEPERDFLELRDQCERLGVLIHQMHGPDLTDEWGIKGLARQSLIFAHILGVSWVVFHPVVVSIPKSKNALEEIKKQNLKLFDDLVEVAYEFKVGIAVENLDKNVIIEDKPLELWIVKRTDPKIVGICWDTGHANLQRRDQYQAITEMGEHLVATHIDDNDGSSDKHLMPFEGNIDWKAVASALNDIEYAGFFNLEIGGSVHRVPLQLREVTLEYALKLTKSFCEGKLW